MKKLKFVIVDYFVDLVLVYEDGGFLVLEGLDRHEPSAEWHEPDVDDPTAKREDWSMFDTVIEV